MAVALSAPVPDSDFNRPAASYSRWRVTLPGGAPDLYEQIVEANPSALDGAEGTIRLRQEYGLEITNAKGTTITDVSPKLLSWASRPWHNIQESVYAIQQHWVDQLKRGAEHSTSGADNLKTFALVEAAYDSASRGQTIDVGAMLR